MTTLQPNMEFIIHNPPGELAEQALVRPYFHGFTKDWWVLCQMERPSPDSKLYSGTADRVEFVIADSSERRQSSVPKAKSFNSKVDMLKYTPAAHLEGAHHLPSLLLDSREDCREFHFK